ncbi:MAG: hypothetical protein JWL63_866 [Rhodocyclales bacterium]|nr:hypothetical protein [Rhodocyclales bacterium]
MSRKIVFLIAFSAVTACPAAMSSVKAAPEAKHETKHLSRVSDRKSDLSASTRRHREVIAMAPTEAEIQGWRMKVAAADAAATQVPAESIHVQEQGSGDNLNVFAMLAAALGLGVMSIIRRMGRF